MKATKYINSKGLPKGAFIYKIKKDGTKSARPTFHQFCGTETPRGTPSNNRHSVQKSAMKQKNCAVVVFL